MIKYPMGTILIALVGESAYQGEQLQQDPVLIPPDTVAVVVDVIEATESEYFLEFPSHNARVLLDERILDDRKRYIVITPADVARMHDRLTMANHNLHCILVALEGKDTALATTLVRSEKGTMAEFLRQFLPP